MALGTPVAGAAEYLAGLPAPTYPTGITSTDVLVLIVGQKPTAANGGAVTTPSGWTLREELTGAGGYGATIGVDTGNTNLRFYTKNTVTGAETGTLALTGAGTNVAFAQIIRIPTGGGAISFGSADGQRTTTPTSPMTVALTDGATATAFQSGDLALWAMCIPTDVLNNGFTSPTITATGATFAAGVELTEYDSGLGNDIGGYAAYASVSSGSSSSAPSVQVTLSGTLTNVRGPVGLLRIREAGGTTYNQSTTETGSGSDSSTNTISRAGATTETGSSADSSTTTGSFGHTAQDTQTAADSSTNTAIRAGATTETQTTTDASTGGLALTGATTETGSSSDSSVAVSPISGAATETGSVADSQTTTALLGGAAQDTQTASDSSTNTAVRAGAAADTQTATDTSTGVLQLAGAVTETGSAADSSARSYVLTTIAADTQTATDAVSASFAQLVSITETGTATDTAGATLPVILNFGLINSDVLNVLPLNANASPQFVYETLAASDSAARAASTSGTASDTLSASDGSSITLSLTFQETVTAADTPAAVRTRVGADTETLAASDSATTVRTLLQTHSEALVGASTQIGNLPNADNLTETATAAETQLAVVIPLVGVQPQWITAVESGVMSAQDVTNLGAIVANRYVGYVRAEIAVIYPDANVQPQYIIAA